jgi:predicted dehydrogenase
MVIVQQWQMENDFDAIFVCVPPTYKQPFINFANDNLVPVFCEADIVSYKGDYYPSRTLVYHPGIKEIKKALENDEIGNICTFNYHLGQHIRDWHIGADYSNYYAAKQETGACKEMFVFEIAWLSWLFGEPVEAQGVIDKKLKDPDVSADDVYAAIVTFSDTVAQWGWLNTVFGNKRVFDGISGTILIDIISRPAIRELTIVGDEGMIKWNWSNHYIQIFKHGKCETIWFKKGIHATGYDPNIPECMYTDEVEAFLEDVKNEANYTLYGYTPEDEEEVVKMLRRISE